MKLANTYNKGMEYTPAEAVAKQVIEAGGRRDGTIEQLQERVEELTAIVGRLLEHLIETQPPLARRSREEWVNIIGYSWTEI